MIAHYLFGVLSALCSSAFIMYVVLGGLMAAGAMGPSAPGDQILGSFMLSIATAVVLAGWAFSALVIYAGRSLGRRKRHGFCILMACLCCAHVPVGTILGVFTIIVLARPGVRELFAASGSYQAT